MYSAIIFLYNTPLFDNHVFRKLVYFRVEILHFKLFAVLEDISHGDIGAHMLRVKALEDKLRGLTAEKIYIFKGDSSII